jgi:hypothetical protein
MPSFAPATIWKKKEQGDEPRSKICVDPVFPKNSDLVLIVGVALLVRAGLLPNLDHQTALRLA